MAKVEVKVSIDLDTVRACIETANLGAWACFGWDDPDCEGQPTRIMERASEAGGAFLTWHRWPLTDSDIQNALQLMATDRPAAFAWWLDGSWGAIAGDLLVQYAVIGRTL